MEFQKMKDVLVAAAERAGLTDYEIYCESAEQVSVETLRDQVSAFSSGVSGGICFRCIVNGKLGSASGELMTAEAMEELVARAIENAAVIDSDDVPEIYAGSPSYAKPEIPEPKIPDASTMRHLALDLQAATYAASDKVSDGTQSGVISAVREIALTNSKGVSLSNRVGVTGGYAVAIVREGEEARDAFRSAEGADMKALGDLPKEAVARALSKLGAGTIASGKYNIVFSGEQFRDFLATFSPIFSGKQALLGLSLLAGKEGTQIGAPIVDLVDDPMVPGAAMQTPFDGEGVATSRKYVVEKGVLKTLLYDLTTAKKAGVASTGNGLRGGYSSPVSIAPYHFCLGAGKDSLDDLLAAAGDGIYVTGCKGFHAGASSVTGDFSIESEGFRIRNGKLAEPIRSFTVAGNFFELLKNISRIGNTVYWPIAGDFTCFGSPDILVPEMSVAGEEA